MPDLLGGLCFRLSGIYSYAHGGGFTALSAIRLLLGRRQRAVCQKHNMVKEFWTGIKGKHGTSMIYKRTLLQGSAHHVLRKNRETWSYLGNPRQPVAPFPACLFCVFKHHLRDVCIAATLWGEGLSVVEKRFQP